MARSTLYDDFLHFTRIHSLFPGASSILAACSGGPDSVALLDLLHRYSRRHSLKLSVCHLDHGLRGADSKADAAFVKALAEKLSLPFFTARKNVNLIARNRSLSIEAAARAARYEFFAKSARALSCSAVATAHTLSDNAETVLQRIIEGAGPDGLSGIPLRRPISTRPPIEVVRPLLFATRDDVEHYLSSRNLSSRLDRSNLEPIYLRNRIRLELLPLLKEMNPSVEIALDRVARSAGAMVEILDPVLDWVQKNDIRFPDRHSAVIQLKPLIDESPIFVTMLLKRVLSTIAENPRSISSSLITQLYAHCAPGHSPGTLDLPCGLVAVRDYDTLTIRPKSLRKSRPSRARKTLSSFSKELRVPGRATLPAGLGRIEAKSFARFDLEKFLISKSPTMEVLDAAKVTAPLAVRFPHPGDRFCPLGAPGAKKLQDFFTDLKVPRAARSSTPVVTDALGVIYVAGLRIADRVKVTPKTCLFLRLTWLKSRP